MSFLRKAVTAVEVKRDKGYYADREADKWGNYDLFPILAEHRHYTARSYWAYWIVAGVTASTWSFGSSLLSAGLTAGEAIGAVIIGATFSSILAFFCGQPGRNMHLGFTIMSRATFGMVGSYFSIMLAVFQNLVWFGIQSYQGGQALVVMLSAIFPQFLNLKNTLPASAGITTQALAGFLLYFIFFVPILFVHPRVLHRLLYPALFIVSFAFVGVLGWAISANHGSSGSLVNPTIKLSSVETGFSLMSGACGVAGSYTGASIRISDWTRFAKKRNAPTVPMVLAMPITFTISSVFGVIVASAIQARYGVLQWNPIFLMQYIQTVDYTPACRAGTFFAGLAFLCSQIFVNLTLNTVSAGMDLVGLFPRFVTMRRGAFIMCACGILIQPWRFLTQAETFITVLSSFGVFVGPITGVIVCDFWVVRKQRWKVPDLFKKNGIYWFTAGCNWRAFAAFTLGFIWSMPGFVTIVNGAPIAVGWTRLYQCAFPVGFGLSFLVFWAFNVAFPPEGNGIAEPFEPDSDVYESQAKINVPLGD